MSIIERCIIVVILSIFDIIFTLHHVANGAVELNPLMAYCLEVGSVFFVMVKFFMTVGFCGFLMYACTNEFRFWLVGWGLNIIIVGYVSTCLYHFYLFLEPGLQNYSYM